MGNVKNKFITSIGGQALIEGVMMRGPETSAMAVRKPDGTIYTETWKTAKPKWYNKIPFIRGSFSLISSMITGYKTLMKSAEIAGFDDGEEEPGKVETWLADKLGVNIMTVVAIFAVVFALGLSMLLFIVVPTALGGLVGRFNSSPIVRSVVEGLLKVVVFIAYLLLVSFMPDIRRIFEYHGGEHKTIFCYENKKELTVENVRKMSRLHPRCGTSFILITVVLSIFLFMFIRADSTLIRTGLKLVLMPVVAGVAYEIIRITGRHDNVITRAISKPGMWLQKITTKEPDDEEIEVAIAAMKPVIPIEEGSDKW